MCLIHDLGEAFMGDIPSFDKTKTDETREEDLLRQAVKEDTMKKLGKTEE